ncbi:MAG TPA: cytochrome c-type biogenesis CcmF C-terminal domain-containing protein, partial [candidate division Zixibacteria bacterium]|nr:cytochrome c-type biogenesis CcmF C-terminal domain-containing protein [candidate division Zixibacteria bacterium]
FALAMFAGGASILLGVTDPIYILLLVLGTMAVIANALLVWDRFRKNGRLAGAYIAHVGLAMLLVGAAVSSKYESKDRVALPLGQAVSHGEWTLTYQGKDATAPDGKTPYHILVGRDGSSDSWIASPRQFNLPRGQGVMRKPAVKKFWNKDLYISPLDETGTSDAGETAVLAVDKPASVGGLTMTFLGFEMSGHGDNGPTRVDCPIEVMGEMFFDTLTPAMASTAQGLAEIPVRFADGRYTLGIEKLDAGGAAVAVRLQDRDARSAEVPVFWIELAEKPLINLFWIGTWLMVIGGFLAMFKRIGQVGAPSTKTGEHVGATAIPATVGADKQDASPVIRG